jgi:phosphinothricin acetyltransferase
VTPTAVTLALGVLDASNTASIALHERLGFRHVGTLPLIGFKF